MPKVGIETPQTAHLRGFVVVHVGLALSFLPIGIIAYVEIIRNMRNNDFLSYENSNLGYGNANEVNDCNLALENNKVYIAKSNALHRPTSDGIWYSIICISYGQSDLKQIAVPVNSSTIVYFRSCNNGTWSEWGRFITNSDLNVFNINYNADTVRTDTANRKAAIEYICQQYLQTSPSKTMNAVIRYYDGYYYSYYVQKYGSNVNVLEISPDDLLLCLWIGTVSDMSLKKTIT